MSSRELSLDEWRDRLSHQVKDLSRALNRSLQIRLSDYNVSFGYWSYLRVLWDRDDGITQRELSELVGLTEPTTHTALISMEKMGYIKRHRQPENLRKMVVSLTPEGKALKYQLIPLAQELNQIAVQGIAAEDIEIFRRTIKKMQENLARHDAENSRGVLTLRKFMA